MRAPHLAALYGMLDDRHLERGVAEVVGREGANASHQHSADDSDDRYRRVELITGRRRRRDWTLEEKAEILAASLEPGRTVTDVAAQYQDGSGLCLVTKRLEAGSFTWPSVQNGTLTLNTTQLRLLFSGMDWTQIPMNNSTPARPGMALEKM